MQNKRPKTRLLWSDNDHYFGPFTYAKSSNRKDAALVLGSGDDDDDPGCDIRVTLFGHTLILALPGIIQPHRRKVMAHSWDAATVERLGRNWYYDASEREYGISYSGGGYLQLKYGRQTDDSRSEQRKGYFLPWTQWRFVRLSLYGLSGEHYWTEPRGSAGERMKYDEKRAIENACPTATFAFSDYDGEPLTVRTKIEEREWKAGEGWFKWLSWFARPKVRRSLDLRFSGETGRKKGSWKGGTTGHGIEMLLGELHEDAFRRYCAEHEMTFNGYAPVAECLQAE